MAAHSTSGGPNAIATCNQTYHCAADETYGATLNANLQLDWKRDLARNKTCKMDGKKQSSLTKSTQGFSRPGHFSPENKMSPR